MALVGKAPQETGDKEEAPKLKGEHLLQADENEMPVIQ